MDMYVRMFDDLKRREDDNPTIGIIFCMDKDETIVKYSVLHESQQIFASKYMTDMPYLFVKSSVALNFTWTGTRSAGF